MKKGSIKNNRINSEVQKAISETIDMELKDPRIHPMTSVNRVEVATDLKTCKAYISVLGDDEAVAETIEGLKSAEGYLRTSVAKKVNLRNTPEIIFIPDQSIEYGIRMTQLIDEVMKDLPDDEAAETAGVAADADDGSGDTKENDL